MAHLWKLGALLLLGCFGGLLLVHAARADELTAEQRKQLEEQANTLNEQSVQLYQAGRYTDAVKKARVVLDICHQLYPADRYPKGTPTWPKS